MIGTLGIQSAISCCLCLTMECKGTSLPFIMEGLCFLAHTHLADKLQISGEKWDLLQSSCLQSHKQRNPKGYPPCGCSKQLKCSVCIWMGLFQPSSCCWNQRSHYSDISREQSLKKFSKIQAPHISCFPQVPQKKGSLCLLRKVQLNDKWLADYTW